MIVVHFLSKSAVYTIYFHLRISFQHLHFQVKLSKRNMTSVNDVSRDESLKNELTPQLTPTQEHKEPTSVVDGGFWAWVQCVTGFCVFFNTFGLLNSFGKSALLLRIEALLTPIKAHFKPSMNETFCTSLPRARFHGLERYNPPLS